MRGPIGTCRLLGPEIEASPVVFIMDVDARRWRRVRYGASTGTLALTSERLEFRNAEAAPDEPPELFVTLRSLQAHQVLVKKASSRLRLAHAQSQLEFEFSSTDALQSFLEEFGKELPIEATANERDRRRDDVGSSFSSASTSTDSNGGLTESSPSIVIPENDGKPFLLVNVGHPVKVSTDLSRNDTYVVFSITTKSNLQAYKSERVSDKKAFVWTTHHRFREFEALRSELVLNYPDAAIPPLPSKAFMNRFNASFLEERSQALNKFLSAVVANPRLRAAPELSAFLIKDPHRHALTVDGQPSTSPSDKGGVVDHYLVDNPLTSAIENTLMHAWTGDRKSQPTFETQMEQDYYNIQKIAKRWDVAPSKLPFQKFVVLSLGTTSAGKTSYVNHFFGLTVKKEADAQQDVCFTIVEVVPSATFENYSLTRSVDSSVPPSYPKFSKEQLQANVSDVYSDARYSNVFVYLDTASTLSRYHTQLAPYAAAIAKFSLFQAVLVNEHYLPVDSPTSSLAMKTIMIDSPGFTSETLIGDDLLEKFLGNLRILQALFSLADLSLFFIPATHMNMVSNQLHVLELALLSSIVGFEHMEKIIHQSLAKDKEKGAHSGLLATVMRTVRKSLNGSNELVYQGTSVWERMLFVLSKVDLLEDRHEALRHVYYELGGLFASSFTFLPNPVADQILTLSLPQRSKSQTNSQLQSLQEKIKARAAQSPYEKRVEVAIQALCSALRQTVSSSWSKYLTRDKSEIEHIYARSVQRMQNTAKQH